MSRRDYVWVQETRPSIFPPVNPAYYGLPCSILCVGNLPLDTSEEELTTIFSTRRGYKHLYFQTKQNEPICFVEFENVFFAIKALIALYGHHLRNSVDGGIRLSFCKDPHSVQSGQVPKQTTYPNELPLHPQPLNSELSACPFELDYFSQPRMVRGILGPANNIWFSKLHWPENPQHASLFTAAKRTWQLIEPELRQIWDDLGRKTSGSWSITPYMHELRMAGTRLPGQSRITLSPSVWIRTTDEAIKMKAPWKRLKELIHYLGLHPPVSAHVYAEGGLRLAHGSAQTSLHSLPLGNGIPLAGDLKLFTHIAKSHSSLSPCGKPCLTTMTKNGDIVYQQLSRVGGIVSCAIPPRWQKFFTTSGHAMLQYLINSESRDEDEPTGQHSRLFAQHNRATIWHPDFSESDDDSELIENSFPEAAVQEQGHINLDDRRGWDPAWPFAINFIRHAGVDPHVGGFMVNRKEPAASTDFALLYINNLPMDDQNSYFMEPTTLSGKDKAQREKIVQNHLADSSLSEMAEVVILLGDETENAHGVLHLPEVPLVVGKTQLSTRRLSLKAPLSQGTSGSWVIDKYSGALCGSVVAVFEGEYSALIITAQTLLSDIVKYTNNVTIAKVPSPRQPWGEDPGQGSGAAGRA